MVRWTATVAFLTGGLVFVGVITAIIFYRQLFVMQGQLDEMRSASGQTDKTIVALNSQAASLEGQLASLKAFQRAFVIIPTPVVQTVIDPRNQNRAHKPLFIWENSGVTPTRNLTPKNK